jgi:peroxiredoxin Q/BCP
MANLKEGALAPKFKLPDENGSVTSLSDFKGKWVVLYFYPKDMTPGCTQEACDFRDSLNRLKSKKAQVFGVSKDSPERHQKFIEKEGLNFHLLSDEDASVCKLYGVFQKKSLYGREFMGIVRTTFIIDPKGKIAKIFPKVKVTGHVDQILDFLNSP